MKALFSTLILSLVLVLGTTQQSFSQENKTQNYVVLTKKVEQLKPILLAAKDLAAEDGANFEIPAMYESQSIPTTYVINSNGELVFTHQGMADYNRADFKEFLKSL